MARDPVELQPDELLPALLVQQQAFEGVHLDSSAFRWSGFEAVRILWLVLSSCRSDLPSLLGSPHEHCNFAEDFKMSHGISFAAN